MDVLHFIEGRSLATLNIGQTVLILVSVLYLQITTEYIGRRMVPLDINDIKNKILNIMTLNQREISTTLPML